MTSHLGRRKFLATLGGAAATWPLAALAQHPKVPTIGALVIGNISPEQFWREFRQGLRDLGYVEGQNIRFEFRSAEGRLDRLPELAAELVRLKVDIIVTWFTPTALAAKQATREIPIVMAETGDPIGTGLVASLPRPGGNVTGMASVTARIGWQVCPTDPRHAAIDAPRDRPGERDRSLLQTFPPTDPAWRRSHRNYDQPCKHQQQ
jgi:putative tryptophan/tyrosine transport system substrate-binding protein